MTEYNHYFPEAADHWDDPTLRTAYWIDNHAPDKISFYSPNCNPAMGFNGDFAPEPPSDSESTHSLPPKMVLQFGDGRPDERIGERHRHGGHPRRKSKLSESTNRPSSRKIVDTATLPPQPEQIRILPSLTSPTQSPESRHSRHHQRSMSMSAPRSQSEHRDRRSHRSSSRHHGETLKQERPVGPIRENSYVIIEPASHPVAFTHSQPAPYNTFSGKSSHGAHRSHKQSPPMIYGPSSHSRKVDYQPPVYGPNGMVYSHSASQAQPYHASYRVTPSPGPESRPSRDSQRPTRGDRKRAHSLQTVSRKDRARGSMPRPEGEETDASTGSYYVLPSHGQKVHIITPDRGHPVETHPPANRTMPPPLQNTTKQPFLRRLFSMKMRNAGDSEPTKNTSS